MNIGFTKMHGLGNDFVVIDNFNGKIKLSKEQISFICDRHFGIGADGLILVEKVDDVDCFMNYYNSDGTQAEMCGNGIRCVARFLKDYYLKSALVFKIDTRAGLKEVKYENDDTFSVNMGKPVFSHIDFPDHKINLQNLELDFVSVGNPHAVAFVDDISKFDLKVIGPLIENDINFPNKINFELVEKKDDDKYKALVWERGCGETLACGTGACAIYSIIKKQEDSKKDIIVELPGGELFITKNENEEIIMKGKATNVFSGMIYVKE
ncbi:MAG: diaminopimelate epimerase, partial [bacterium]